VAEAPLNLIYVANFSKLGDMEDDRKLFLLLRILDLSARTYICSALLLGWGRWFVIGSTGLRWQQKSNCGKTRGLFWSGLSGIQN
jgi:hypothetical protein